MAYSGGNADNITGRVYWAVSSDGIAWSRYAVNAGTEGITPIIYGKYHDECSAVGDWPKRDDGSVDPIVKRHAAIINKVRESVRRKEAIEMFVAMKVTGGV